MRITPTLVRIPDGGTILKFNAQAEDSQVGDTSPDFPNLKDAIQTTADFLLNMHSDQLDALRKEHPHYDFQQPYLKIDFDRLIPIEAIVALTTFLVQYGWTLLMKIHDRWIIVAENNMTAVEVGDIAPPIRPDIKPGDIINIESEGAETYPVVEVRWFSEAAGDKKLTWAVLPRGHDWVRADQVRRITRPD